MGKGLRKQRLQRQLLFDVFAKLDILIRGLRTIFASWLTSFQIPTAV